LRHSVKDAKGVYVEKPLAKIIEEGRHSVTAARRYSRIVQLRSPLSPSLDQTDAVGRVPTALARFPLFEVG
jgi:hypothetical protein